MILVDEVRTFVEAQQFMLSPLFCRSPRREAANAASDARLSDSTRQHTPRRLA
jgi:hypothetical protein